MAKRSYSDETKAAVMAALLAGQSIAEVASAYKIPPSTVKNWSAEAKRIQEVGPEKREAIGDLLLAYLRTNLETLQKQMATFSDGDWLKKQDASDAAVLHGVMADKAHRLLEALRRTDE